MPNLWPFESDMSPLNDGSHYGKLPHRPCPNPASSVNCGGPHSSDSPTCPSYLFEKTALEDQATRKLTIQFVRQCALALPYCNGLSYAETLNRGTGPSRHGHRVRSSLSSSGPASADAEFASLKRTSFITLRLSPPLSLLPCLLLFLLPFL